MYRIGQKHIREGYTQQIAKIINLSLEKYHVYLGHNRYIYYIVFYIYVYVYVYTYIFFLSALRNSFVTNDSFNVIFFSFMI